MVYQHDELILIELADVRRGVAVITGYLALLCWWVGMASYVFVGGLAGGGSGLVVFLTIPVLATVAVIMIARHRRSPATRNGPARHRSGR